MHCSICSDRIYPAFPPFDSVCMVKRCGHCFHEHCLINWIKCTENCPKCRSRCRPWEFKKIYPDLEMLYDFSMRSHAPEDADSSMVESLMKKIDNHVEELEKKDKEIKVVEDELEDANKALTVAKEIQNDLFRQIEVLQEENGLLKDELSHLEVKQRIKKHRFHHKLIRLFGEKVCWLRIN